MYIYIYAYMQRNIEGERKDIKHMGEIIKIGKSGQRIYRIQSSVLILQFFSMLEII